MQNVCQFDLRNARVADMKPTTVRRRQTMTTRFRFTIISMLRMLVAAGIHRDGTQFGNQLVDGHPARCQGLQELETVRDGSVGGSQLHVGSVVTTAQCARVFYHAV